MNCSRCQVSEEERWLDGCPICKKSFCHECAYVFAGKNFCSKNCGSFFFFGEGEEEETAEEDY